MQQHFRKQLTKVVNEVPRSWVWLDLTENDVSCHLRNRSQFSKTKPVIVQCVPQIMKHTCSSSVFHCWGVLTLCGGCYFRLANVGVLTVGGPKWYHAQT